MRLEYKLVDANCLPKIRGVRLPLENIVMSGPTYFLGRDRWDNSRKYTYLISRTLG